MSSHARDATAPADARSTEPARPCPAPHVLGARQGDRTILLDMRRGRYYALDGVGGRIWELLVEGVRMREIEERVADEYDALPERIAADLRALVAQLRGKGLVS